MNAALGWWAWVGCAPSGPPLGGTVTVSVRGFGTPEVLEDSLAQPIEAALASLDGVVGLRTRVDADRVTVVATVHGSPAEVALAARDAVDPARLPSDAAVPTLSFATGAPQVSWVILQGDGATSAWDTVVGPRLEQVPGVVRLDVCGRAAPRVALVVDPAVPRALGALVEDLAPVDDLPRPLADLAAPGLGFEPGLAPDGCRAWFDGRPATIGRVWHTGPLDLAVLHEGLPDGVTARRGAGTEHEGVSTGPAEALAGPGIAVRAEADGALAVLVPPGAPTPSGPGVALWEPGTARVVRLVGPRAALAAAGAAAAAHAALHPRWPAHPTVSVDVDADRAAARGVSPRDVALAVAAAGQGIPVGLVTTGDGTVPVVVRTRSGAPGDPEEALIPTPSGPVSLTTVARVVRGTERPLLRIDREPALELVANGAVGDLEARFAEVPLPAGLRVEVVPLVP